ncbi:MAG: ABC transporter permease [Methylococcaceae bacterium]|nr:ABC transporter permease [Methylococcaceae bacterium]
MRTVEFIRFSFRSITAYPARSGLTALGILIGITAVVLLTSIGEGIHRYVLDEFTQFGANLVAVKPGKTETFGLSGATISNVRPLSLNDADALSRLDHIVALVPVVQGNARIESGKKSRRATILGVGPAVAEVWKMNVAYGRFLPDDDQRMARSYAVLGSRMRMELFGDGNPLGQPIRVGEDRYRVIGVMQKKGQMLGFDMDDTVYIPVGRAMELFNRESVMEIDLLYEAEISAEHAVASVTRLLKKRHGREDFTLITQKQMLEILDSVLNILTLAVGTLGGISLLVGSVGILTIMTLSVSERISEIGLFRAIGAERKHILGMFLGEAVALSTVGGVCGILLGVLLVKLIGWLLPALPVKLAWPYLIFAFGLSAVIGMFSGVLPALRAAKLDPLEALRTE